MFDRGNKSANLFYGPIFCLLSFMRAWRNQIAHRHSWSLISSTARIITWFSSTSLWRWWTRAQIWNWEFKNIFKVEKKLKGGLDSISSPSVKIQIMSGEVCLRCRGKTLLGVVNKRLKSKSLSASPSNVLPYYNTYLKKPFPPTIWIFTEV